MIHYIINKCDKLYKIKYNKYDKLYTNMINIINKYDEFMIYYIKTFLILIFL